MGQQIAAVDMGMDTIAQMLKMALGCQLQKRELDLSVAVRGVKKPLFGSDRLLLLCFRPCSQPGTMTGSFINKHHPLFNEMVVKKRILYSLD